jgi:hypothetical protein
MMSSLKKDSNKQTNEVRKTVQGLGKEVSNVEEKEMQIMKNKQVGMLETKS